MFQSKKLLLTIIGNVVSYKLAKEFQQFYSQYKGLQLGDIGINSLTLVQILLEMNSKIELKLDFNELDITLFQTLSDIESVIDNQLKLLGKNI